MACSSIERAIELFFFIRGTRKRNTIVSVMSVVVVVVVVWWPILSCFMGQPLEF